MPSFQHRPNWRARKGNVAFSSPSVVVPPPPPPPPPPAGLLVDEVANDLALANHADVIFYPSFAAPIPTNINGQWWWYQYQIPTGYPSGVGFNTTVVDASAVEPGLSAWKIGSLYKPDHYLETDTPPPFFTSTPGVGEPWCNHMKWITNGSFGSVSSDTPLFPNGVYKNDLYFRYCFMLDQSVVTNWNTTPGQNPGGFKMCALRSWALSTGQKLAQTWWLSQPGTMGAAAGKLRLYWYTQGDDIGIAPSGSTQWPPGGWADITPGVWNCLEQRFKVSSNGGFDGARGAWLNDVELYTSENVQMFNGPETIPNVALAENEMQLYYGGVGDIPAGEMFVYHTAWALAYRRIGMPKGMR